MLLSRFDDDLFLKKERKMVGSVVGENRTDKTRATTDLTFVVLLPLSEIPFLCFSPSRERGRERIDV